MRAISLTATTLAGLLSITGCSDAQVDGRKETMLVEDLGIVATFGRTENAEPLSIFQNLVDGQLLSDGVALLDASAPYVRLFAVDGEFRAAIVRQGQGPGEARRPIGLKRLRDELLVSERARVHVIRLDGSHVATLAPEHSLIRGAAADCAGDILLLTTSPVVFEGVGSVIRMSPARPLAVDTVAKLSNLRANSRQAHPMFASSHPHGTYIFSEEINSPRLLDIRCDNTLLDSPAGDLGRHERFELLSDGGQALHPAEPPFPAGVIRLNDELLWAVQRTDTVGVRIDSVTVLTRGVDDVLKLHGWHRLLDADKTQVLLSTNEPVPHAYTISTHALAKAIGAQ